MFRERGREKEREGNTDLKEKHQSVASHMCPDWGSNLQPLGTGEDAPPTKPPRQDNAFQF